MPGSVEARAASCIEDAGQPPRPPRRRDAVTRMELPRDERCAVAWGRRTWSAPWSGRDPGARRCPSPSARPGALCMPCALGGRGLALVATSCWSPPSGRPGTRTASRFSPGSPWARPWACRSWPSCSGVSCGWPAAGCPRQRRAAGLRHRLLGPARHGLLAVRGRLRPERVRPRRLRCSCWNAAVALSVAYLASVGRPASPGGSSSSPGWAPPRCPCRWASSPRPAWRHGRAGQPPSTTWSQCLSLAGRPHLRSRALPGRGR